MSVRKRTWGGETTWLVVDKKSGETVETFTKRKDAVALAGSNPGQTVRKSVVGEVKTGWLVDYVDGKGERRSQTFRLKKDADARWHEVREGVRKGTHTPTSKSITVAKAAEDWLAYGEGEKLQRSTLDQYRTHIKHHIVPRIGTEKLASLTTPRVNAFRDELIRDLTRVMARKVLVSFKAILKDAKRRGNVAQNVASDVTISADRKEQLQVGIDIPTPEEISRIVAAATGRWRPFLIVAIYTGLRASELRGLRWVDVDLKAGTVTVKQRADRYKVIDKPKSAAGERTIPIGPFVVNTLKEWRLANPHELVFPTGAGHIESHANLVARVWQPVQVAAGVVNETTGLAKYTGLHALRHFYASWCINRKVDGGLELPAKIVQARLGHATIVETLDTYGHLFKSDDDGSELAEAERTLLRLATQQKRNIEGGSGQKV
jgi:integrase